VVLCATLLLHACVSNTLAAPLDLPVSAPDVTQPTANDSLNRYGPFGLLDRRSIYGQYWFVEPLRADEADVDNEVRADYFHAENRGRQFDSVKLEVEKSFGLFTVEIAPRYESDRTWRLDPRTGGRQRQTAEGFTNIELAARHPVFQYVSPDRAFDTTFVVGMEVAPPTLGAISKDLELVPKLFNLTRLGEHLSIQTALGDSILIGPVGRGLWTLEYDAVLGYELPQNQLPLPGVISAVPLVEFDGELAVNQAGAGHDILFGTVGVRLNLVTLPLLPAQPRLGVGYVFPIDKGARDEFRWGIVTSLVFEF
jgi:hypothetical protein